MSKCLEKIRRTSKWLQIFDNEWGKRLGPRHNTVSLPHPLKNVNLSNTALNLVNNLKNKVAPLITVR